MFTLTIETDNAAFEDDAAPEIAAILRRLAHDITDGGALVAPADGGRLADGNGNTVGRWSYAAEGGAA